MSRWKIRLEDDPTRNEIVRDGVDITSDVVAMTIDVERGRHRVTVEMHVDSIDLEGDLASEIREIPTGEIDVSDLSHRELRTVRRTDMEERR